MADEANRGVVEGFWKAVERGDLDAANALLADDVVIDYPQSGERIVGRRDWRSVISSHPTLQRVTIKSIVGEGSFWGVEAWFEYGTGEPWYMCALCEVRDGRLVSSREFFGQAFEAAEWRRSWVREIPPTER